MPGLCLKHPTLRLRWILYLAVFFWIFAGIALAQTSSRMDREVKGFFEEAQRYHLGIDRAVNLPKAYQHYQEVVKRDPGHQDAYYNLAHICFVRKRYNLAVKYYGKVIGLDPGDADAYNNLGTVYRQQGNFTQARKMYEKAIRLNRNLGVAYYNLANLTLEQGDEDRALRIVEEGLKADPDHPELVKLQSRIKGELGGISNTTVGVVVGAFVCVLAGYYFLVGKSAGV